MENLIPVKCEFRVCQPRNLMPAKIFTFKVYGKLCQPLDLLLEFTTVVVMRPLVKLSMMLS